MKFSDAIIRGLQNIGNFSGRATRSEFWLYYLFVFLLAIAATIIQVFLFGIEIDSETDRIISQIMQSVTTVLTLSAFIRRLHDTGKSGWWLLIIFTIIGIIPLIYWLAQDTSPEGNKYN